MSSVQTVRSRTVSRHLGISRGTENVKQYQKSSRFAGKQVTLSQLTCAQQMGSRLAFFTCLQWLSVRLSSLPGKIMYVEFPHTA